MANWAVACVVCAIRTLGLEVSPHKSEAVFFHDGLRSAPPPAQIMVGNVPVPVGPSIKYLGLTLDGRWSFEDHFVELAPRLERLAAATSRLMLNLGGPSEKARHLYARAIRSVALYGAPVWADDLAVTSRAAQAVRHFERRVAARVARTYRTVSHRAATALAGTPNRPAGARVRRRVRAGVAGAGEGCSFNGQGQRGSWTTGEATGEATGAACMAAPIQPTRQSRRVGGLPRPSIPAWQSGWTGIGAE
ncbi:hypothetical protein DMN91_012977 [Ooceraea biroi]|uniref:Reverse transcriptase domain-containing protein n=1 Tax=Ooceraea biroi TaxID=2015173 RepID=A0A3L8D3W2_OOCBI|nr:uncharacterized protein LOC113563431 [Ooceraea biroi]RLU15090.1 hypothetical protein DMN91_012977 [Ooceraea biroi]